MTLLVILTLGKYESVLLYDEAIVKTSAPKWGIIATVTRFELVGINDMAHQINTGA